MKKFIGKISIFASIATIIILGCTVGIYFIQSKISFNLPPDKNILVVGDSHTECAIDDNIHSRIVNVSQSASPYLYSYCKIKKFLSENNHIDTVLLSFHYEALTSNIDDRWILDEQRLIRQIPRLLMLLDKEDIAILANKKAAFIKAILSLPYGIAFKFIVRKCCISYNDLNIGEYLKLDSDKLQEDIFSRQEQEHKQEETDISFYQKEYLLKIVSLCKSKNVELILINTPTYKPEIYGNIDKLNDYYNAYLSGVKYMDYSAFPLPDSCYGDIGHLNYKGAEIFSQSLLTLDFQN
jgi:hypothetical protein